MQLQWRAIVLVVAGFAAGVVGTAFWSFPPKSSSDWASWIQALGSIGAIAGAAWIAGAQQRGAKHKEKLAELRVVEAACRLGVESLAIAVDAREMRRGGMLVQNFYPTKRREVAKISETLDRLPIELMLADGVLHSIFQIRTQLAHLDQVLSYTNASLAIREETRNQFQAIEDEIRQQTDGLKAVLVRFW